MNATTESVLARLRAASDFVSGQLLSQELGVSRAAIWKAVHSLTDRGYQVEAVRRRGYRLQQTPEGAIDTELSPLLTTRELGRRLLCLEETGSTNLVAKRQAGEQTPHGLLVCADRQTSGRGRMQRPWHSPGGRNLYFSLLLRPQVAPSRVPQLAIVAALAVQAGVAELLPELPVRIKWPNDIWTGQRKLCGILCEMEAEMTAVHHVVVGIGLNVNTGEDELPPELRETATSLRIAVGREIPRAALLAAILNQFEPMLDRWTAADDLSPFLEVYSRFSLLDDRQIRVEQLHRTLVGRACGIGPQGELLLETPDGLVRIHSGDAHIDRQSLVQPPDNH